MQRNLNLFINTVRSVIEAHRLGDGAYARWTRPNPMYGTNLNMGVNEYGCADAANILYTIGDFPRDPGERQAFVNVLQGMQNPQTGLFEEATHHTIHTTAHCIAALELFDVMPLYRLAAYDEYQTREGLYGLLESQRWVEGPWSDSHKGAGLYAALNITGEASAEWNQWYFDWFWQEADPETGLWRRGCVKTGVKGIHEHMAGSFHYLFNHEYAHMPLRYPEKMIDSCIAMYEEGTLEYGGRTFGGEIGFLEVDWVYCVTRALRQCGHRYAECKAMLTEFAEKYVDYLSALDPATSAGLDDLHALFGAMCCLAELQQFLPGCLITDKPMKLVLDRRPFI